MVKNFFRPDRNSCRRGICSNDCRDILTPLFSLPRGKNSGGNPIPIHLQQNYYNDVPFGDMLFEGKDGDENADFTGSLMDTSINNAVLEFGFPVEFFLDMLCRYGWRDFD